MANISNTISLKDHMSPVLRSVTKALGSTLKVMEQVDKQSNLGKPSKAYQQAAKDIGKAKTSLNDFIRYQKDLNYETARMNEAWNNLPDFHYHLANLAHAVYLIKNLKSAITDLMEPADTAASAVARIGLYNTSNEMSSSQIYEQVYKAALASRSGLEATGDLITRLLVSGVFAGQANAGMDSVKTAELINKTLVAGGGTATENERALLQLAQGLSSGVLQGDELRSIREQAPYLASILAKGLGKIGLGEDFADLTIGDLKELGAKGELTASRIVAAFNAMNEEIERDFKRMPRTWGQAMTQIQTVWDYFIYEMNQGDGAIARLTEKAWEFADFLASADGAQFLQSISGALALVLDGVDLLTGAFVDLYTFLNDNTPVVHGLLVSLGTVMAIFAAETAINFIAATWPVLLLAAVITGTIVLAESLGASLGDIFGGLAFTCTAITMSIWDLIVLVAKSIGAIFVVLGNIGIAAMVGIWDTIKIVVDSVFTVVGLLWDLLVGFFDGVVTVATVALQGIVELLKLVGYGWDAIFGTNIVNSMDKASAKLADFRHSVVDASKEVMFGRDEFEDLWSYLWAEPEWLSLDKLNELDQFVVNPLDAASFAYDETKPEVDRWAEMLEGINTNMDKIPDYLKDRSLVLEGGEINTVDKVNSVNGSVDINKEDLDLLRDVAAKEFLINLQTVTPTANITFGDVRETADVNAIVDIIEDMVDESLATSLVVD